MRVNQTKMYVAVTRLFKDKYVSWSLEAYIMYDYADMLNWALEMELSWKR